MEIWRMLLKSDWCILRGVLTEVSESYRGNTWQEVVLSAAEGFVYCTSELLRAACYVHHPVLATAAKSAVSKQCFCLFLFFKSSDNLRPQTDLREMSYMQCVAVDLKLISLCELQNWGCFDHFHHTVRDRPPHYRVAIVSWLLQLQE